MYLRGRLFACTHTHIHTYQDTDAHANTGAQTGWIEGETQIHASTTLEEIPNRSETEMEEDRQRRDGGKGQEGGGGATRVKELERPESEKGKDKESKEVITYWQM